MTQRGIEGRPSLAKEIVHSLVESIQMTAHQQQKTLTADLACVEPYGYLTLLVVLALA